VLVVVVNHVRERGKASIMVEAAAHVREEATQWRSAVLLFARTAVRLKIVDSDFLCAVQVPSRFSEQRRNVGTSRTLP
jgi:hypothetical protein